MFGCLRRVGCLVLVALIGAAAYVTRSMWMERFVERRAETRLGWQPAASGSDTAARARIRSLGGTEGAVYANLSGAEIAAVVQAEGHRRQPGALTDIAAAVVGNEVRIRGRVDLTQLRGLDGVSMLRGLVGGPRRLELVGVPSIVAPGRGEILIRSVRIGNLDLPEPVIGQISSRFGRPGKENDEPGRITFPVPAYIGDVRVANGRLTLYKRVP